MGDHAVADSSNLIHQNGSSKVSGQSSIGGTIS